MHLYAHQQKIIDEDPLKCGLWLGTGSGKTRIALNLAKGDILVIAPKTQVEDGNWEREYKQVLTGHLERYTRHSKFPLIKPRLIVISKESFRRDATILPRFNTVIVDEAHTCLGVRPNTRQVMRRPVPDASQLYEALQAYLARTKPDRLYLCTATIVKSPFTVWAAYRLLKPLHEKDEMTSFYKFRDTFYQRLNMPGRDVYSPKRDSKTKDRLAKIVRGLGYVGRLEDYFDVPEQTFITKYVELTQKQKDRIKQAKLDWPDPIVLLSKRHQIENGVLAGDEFNESEEFDNGKIEAILDLALQFPRMVIFAKYTAQIEQLRKAAMKANLVPYTMTGKTLNRGQVLKDVASSSEYIFIVQAQISAGWELPACPVMVFASRTYSFVDYQQGIGRILRANALKKNLYINLVVKGGVDEAVDRSLANKQDFDERLYLNI